MVYIPKTIPKLPKSLIEPPKYRIDPKDFYAKRKEKPLFSAKTNFVKREDLIKKITKDKTRIPQTGWSPAIRGSYSSQEKRKQLAETLFPKEKFGEYVSKKKFQETMAELEKKTKEFKPSMEKFQATQHYNYLKKKSGL